jgi:hypothetical protein
MAAIALNQDKFTIDTHCGPVVVIITDRFFWKDPSGPGNGTTARVGFDSARITVPRPDSYDSDHGGPLDQAWKAYNAAELAEMHAMLDAALPAIIARTQGDPGAWTFSRNANCSMCPCSPGMVAERQLTRAGRVADVWIGFPAELD